LAAIDTEVAFRGIQTLYRTKNLETSRRLRVSGQGKRILIGQDL
jgi:hypothetical protein